jgi:hypothetical protein
MNVCVKHLMASGLLLLAGLGVAAPVAKAAAAQELCTTPGAGVIPVGEGCANQTYAELSAAFWQYALGQPTSTSPLLGSAGADCQLGQSGSVFFLAGRFDGTDANRTCTVPAGKALFFPLIAIIDISTPPGFCTRIPNLGQVADCAPESPAELLADVKPVEDSAVRLNASVDGRSLSPAGFRVQSPAFSLFVPADNLFGGLLPRQAYMAVADGYYLLIAPLPVGTHTLEFGGATRANKFAQKIKYALTIANP